MFGPDACHGNGPRRTRTGWCPERAHSHQRRSIDHQRKGNLSAALEVGAGQRRPLLVDISEALPLDAEVRHYYSGQVLVDGFTALAMVIHASPLGRMMGNVYLRVAKPGIPTRLFAESAHARAWLMTFRQ